jgi:CheY-like chemotaxis protein
MAQILIIDDVPGIRELLATQLTQDGHNVAEAADGEAGLKAMEKQPAELVICDLFMPNKEGLETIRELRHRYPDVIIIAMSGGNLKTSQDFLPFAKAMGADRTIGKPFQLNQLIELISSLVPPCA